jgi:hypothetical protein
LIAAIDMVEYCSLVELATAEEEDTAEVLWLDLKLKLDSLVISKRVAYDVVLKEVEA